MSQLANKLLCRVTSSSNSHPDMPAQTPEEVLQSFIAKDPKSTYTFNSERDAPESELCREGGKLGRECIMIHMHSTRLFQAMQDQGFFCALPMDPKHTEIACQPIPKS